MYQLSPISVDVEMTSHHGHKGQLGSAQRRMDKTRVYWPMYIKDIVENDMIEGIGMGAGTGRRRLL